MSRRKSLSFFTTLLWLLALYPFSLYVNKIQSLLLLCFGKSKWILKNAVFYMKYYHIKSILNEVYQNKFCQCSRLFLLLHSLLVFLACLELEIKAWALSYSVVAYNWCDFWHVWMQSFSCLVTESSVLRPWMNVTAATPHWQYLLNQERKPMYTNFSLT